MYQTVERVLQTQPGLCIEAALKQKPPLNRSRTKKLHISRGFYTRLYGTRLEKLRLYYATGNNRMAKPAHPHTALYSYVSGPSSR